MNIPSHRRLATLVAFGLSAALAQGAPQPPAPDSPEAKQARLAWFKDAKFGLFIHWGLYAIPAGEWKGKHVPGIGLNQFYEQNSVPQLPGIKAAMREVATEEA